jgi:5-methyltetrahydrofolate--homocysteine methyltransferase
MNLLDEIAVSIENGDADEVKKLTEQALSQNDSAEEILNQGLVAGMNVVSEKFKNNEVFIPEVLISAKAMKAGMGVIKPLLVQANVQSKGKVVMGTVNGDLHDIGKSIVAMLLEGAGFDVIDLGADVSLEKFMESIKKEDVDIVGRSALLTTTMTFMKVLIDELEKTGLKKRVKVMVGGAPVTSAFAEEIKADGYAPDAAQAVDLAVSLLN